MSFSIRRAIRALVAPSHRLSCSATVWRRGLHGLRDRGHGLRESGAFLLGTVRGRRRQVSQFVFYDDLDPECLKGGVIRFSGHAYGRLWDRCASTGLRVVADVHTHPGSPRQSGIDRAHPMMATAGHIALIVPRFAQAVVGPSELGIYEYLSNGRWRDWSGRRGRRFFYVGKWG